MSDLVPLPPDPTGVYTSQPPYDDAYSTTANTIRAIKAEGFAAGYDRAIANLRDDATYLAWLRGLGADVMPLTQLTPKARLADFLEAVKETNDVV